MNKPFIHTTQLWRIRYSSGDISLVFFSFVLYCVVLCSIVVLFVGLFWLSAWLVYLVLSFKRTHIAVEHLQLIHNASDTFMNFAQSTFLGSNFFSPLFLSHNS